LKWFGKSVFWRKALRRLKAAHGSGDGPKIAQLTCPSGKSALAERDLIVRLDDDALRRRIWVGIVPAKDLAISWSDPMGNPRMRRDVVVTRAKRIGVERREDRSTAGIVGNACRRVVDLAVGSDRGGKTTARVVGKMDGACGRGDRAYHDRRQDE
jgi:hypothetical protein